MKLEQSIRQKLQQNFAPEFMQITNESQSHGRPPGAETHFHVIVVSEKFAPMSRVRRTQAVQSLLSEERDQGLHALSLRTFTPAEWPKAQAEFDLSSAPCIGRNHD